MMDEFQILRYIETRCYNNINDLKIFVDEIIKYINKIFDFVQNKDLKNNHYLFIQFLQENRNKIQSESKQTTVDSFILFNLLSIFIKYF